MAATQSVALNDFLQNFSNINTFGRYIENVPMFPVFQIAHFILIAVALRSRVGSHEFALKHPLSSWFVNTVSCYGGSIIQNLLLAQPVINVLRDERNFILASLIWFLVFFSPLDIFWRILQFNIVKATLRTLKEVHRVRMIINGLQLASTLHSNSWLIIIIIGAIRGSGAKFIMKPLDHFVRGELISSNELLAPHFATKSSIIVSGLLYYTSVNEFVLSKQELLVFIFAYMVVFQLALLFTNIKDPYLHLEELIHSSIVKYPNGILKEKIDSSKAKKD